MNEQCIIYPNTCAGIPVG